MNQYYDLNKIVQEYLISKNGGKKELDELTERLSNVPVSLNKLEEMLEERYPSCNLSDFLVRAELVQPDTMFLLNELTEQKEADDYTGRTAPPYPLICLSGEAISKNFYKRTKYNFGRFIIPDRRDPTARVLSKPGVGGVAVIFEKDKKLEYIELVLLSKIR